MNISQGPRDQRKQPKVEAYQGKHFHSNRTNLLPIEPYWLTSLAGGWRLRLSIVTFGHPIQVGVNSGRNVRIASTRNTGKRYDEIASR
jgi:hypothetical protein